MGKIFYMLCLVFIVSLPMANAQSKEQSDAKKTYQDIEKTFGSVPTFLKEFPDKSISGAWLEMKNFLLNPQTALSGKDKELIGLAVSAQIPCRYCTYFHTQAAKLNNASSHEIRETIAMAASTRRWSTILNGHQMSLDEFKREADRMLEAGQMRKTRQAEEVKTDTVNKEITTAKEAYSDIEMQFGFVPSFLKNYPEASVAGAWRELRAMMSPDTSLAGKTKELVGLAVAAQIPCPYCTYIHTKAAQLQGASQQEISEAIAMSGLTGFWSTVINGQQVDEKRFQSETDKVMKHLKSKMPKEVTSVE